MSSETAYHIFPLGDSALTIEFGNVINDVVNRKVLTLFEAIQKHPFKGFIEAVPAYCSLTVYYNLVVLSKYSTNETTIYDWVKQQIEELIHLTNNEAIFKGREIDIPVCYEEAFAPDLKALADAKNLSTQEVIAMHTSKKYQVYMLGFLPGFAYMGEVDASIAMPRKAQPVNISAGSVGIAGIQTGIYPLDSPGGWQIIGRTPIQLFDSSGDGTTLFQPGDMVQFISISKHEFANYQSRNP